MITKKDLKEKLEREIVGVTDQSALAQKVLESVRYGVEHYDELDNEAKGVVDAQTKAMGKINEIAMVSVRAQPDSLSKRETLRTHRIAQGSHFEVETLLKQLEERSKEEEPMVAEARKVFMFIAQLAYNYLCDVTEETLKGGGAAAAKLGLFYSAMDEALVAFHLASRTYAPQSMGHTRSIREALDLLDLFEQSPEHITYWASDNHKEREKVSPKNVRKALGKTELDENVYWTLSDIGSHPSFKHVQTKTLIKGGGQRAQVRINVGGSVGQFHTQQALVACITETFRVAVQIADVYADRLLKDELDRDLQEAERRLREFLASHTDYKNFKKDDDITPQVA